MLLLNEHYAGATARAARPLQLASAILLLAGMSACAADEGFDESLESGDDAAENEADFEVLPYSSSGTAQSNAEIFGVSKGEYDMRLKPVSTHQCFLTRISGELDDGYSFVDLHHSTNDAHDHLDKTYRRHVLNDLGDTWKLASANGGSKSLSAQATCVPHSDFVLDPGMVIQSGPFAVTATSGFENLSQVPLSMGSEAIASLDLLSGNFAGGGESAEVIEAPVAGHPSVLRVKDNAVGELEASARPFFVGVPGVTSVNRTSRVSSSGNKKTKLLPTSQGVCYLTRFSGEFRGSEERVRIMPQLDDVGLEWWVFETHAGSGRAYATAECIYYDQREGCNGNGHICL